MDQRDGPGPGPLVDRGVEAELGEVEGCGLQRQRNVDGGVALVDRKADIDAGREARAEPGHAALGLALIADESRLAGRFAGRDAVALDPGPETRRFGSFGGPAAARIVAQDPAETVGRLIAEPLQEITAEIGHGGAGRDRRIVFADWGKSAVRRVLNQ